MRPDSVEDREGPASGSKTLKKSGTLTFTPYDIADLGSADLGLLVRILGSSRLPSQNGTDKAAFL